jgi:hypothetical protein
LSVFERTEVEGSDGNGADVLNVVDIAFDQAVLAVIEDQSGVGVGAVKELREEELVEDVRSCYEDELGVISLQLVGDCHQLRLLREWGLVR